MKHSDRKILVTGAGGFTGSALVRRLVADGYPVRAVVRPGRPFELETHELIEKYEGDLTDRDSVASMVKGCTDLFNIAALFRRAGVPDSDYWKVNRDGVQYLLDAAVSEGIRMFVHCSTIGVCGHIEHPPGDEQTPYHPGDIYQLTKMEGEKLALQYFRENRLKGCVIRPASIYGPGDLRLLKLFKMIKKGKFVVIGSGKPHFHTVFIDDLIQGFILGWQKEESHGEVFICASAEHVPLKALFEMIAAEFGVPPPRIKIPAMPVQVLSEIVEKICVPLRIEPPIYRRRVDFFTKHREFDITKARTVLGYEPSVSLREGLHRTAIWYEKKGLL